MESNSLPIPKDIRWRVMSAVALFLGCLFFFRSLAPVLIIFVIFERGSATQPTSSRSTRR
ncbi:MAG: hypothetical protein IPG04_02155 [Polyangiaceae bacterium]|nr:hypothetical protein [Polyangiaceae bacterium]